MDRARERLERIRVERIRDVFGRSGTPIYAATAILCVIAVETVAIIWGVVDPRRALLWLLLVLLAEASVGLVIRAFHRRPRTDDEVMRWGRLKAAHEAAHGLVWSLSVPLLTARGGDISLLATLMSLVALVSGASPSFAVHLPTALNFISFALLPATAYLFLTQTTPIEGYAATMLVAAFLLSAANAVRWSAVYAEGIELRLDLAAGIEERRQLLAEAETARRLAEEAAAERIRFFGAASHDLRQPVHALGLYTSLLRNDPPPKERRELIDNVATCVDSLEHLFNAILGVARAAGDRQADAPVAFPLQEVVDRVVLQFRPEAAARGLELRRVRTSAWVIASPTAAERILANLVANAVRYTERGKILVGVRRRGDAVEVAVADTGVGMSEPDRERAFDAFFRVRSPQAGGREGFGLGLATVRQLCLTYDHPLAVRSEPGRGTCFTVRLPRADPGSVPLDAPEETPAPPKLNVLLVEDDRLVADAVAKLLDAWGVTVHPCATGDEAMAALAAAPGRWHAIVDYRLGDETGLEIAARIQARYGDRVPISLLTGEADPALFEAAQRQGIAVLHKPLKPIRLRALLAPERDGGAAPV